jgi:hypothetical protein
VRPKTSSARSGGSGVINKNLDGAVAARRHSVGNDLLTFSARSTHLHLGHPVETGRTGKLGRTPRPARIFKQLRIDVETWCGLVQRLWQALRPSDWQATGKSTPAAPARASTAAKPNAEPASYRCFIGIWPLPRNLFDLLGLPTLLVHGYESSDEGIGMVADWQQVTRWQGGKVARWQGGKVARWQGGKESARI